MTRWWAGAGLAIWACATALAWDITWDGITTETVQLECADGTAIHGTLYRSECCEGPAALVLHGTAVSHHSCGPGLAVPLARRGLTVLAIDLRGHGRSSGTLPRHEFDNLETLFDSQADHPEVDAALAFLRAQPSAQADKVALVGHSRGGWVAACVGCRRTDVASVVAICSGPTICDRRLPPNLLLVDAGLDDVIPARQYQIALAHATGADGLAAARNSDPRPGTARNVMTARWSLHITTLASPSVAEAVVWWVSWSCGQEFQTVQRYRVALAWWANLIASGGALLTATALLAAVATRWLPAPALATPVARHRALWLLLLLLTAPVACLLGDLGPDGGLLFAAHAVVHLAMAAVVIALAARLVDPAYLVVTPWSCALRGLGLGLAGAGAMLALLGVTWGTTWFELIPSPRRLAAAGVLIGPVFLCCCALAAATQRLLGVTAATWKGALYHGGAWLGLSLTLWLSYVLWMRQERPLLAIPGLLLAASGVVPLPLWLLRDRPGLGAARATSHAVAVACFLAWHLPFVE
jgi:pimeloyl-ACP methyl ester carboxylesterase